MNAAAAMAAILRDQEEVVRGLLNRGFQTVSLEMPNLKTTDLIPRLVHDVARIDPSLRDLAGRIESVYGEVFRPGVG